MVKHKGRRIYWVTNTYGLSERVCARNKVEAIKKAKPLHRKAPKTAKWDATHVSWEFTQSPVAKKWVRHKARFCSQNKKK